MSNEHNAQQFYLFITDIKTNLHAKQGRCILFLPYKIILNFRHHNHITYYYYFYYHSHYYYHYTNCDTNLEWDQFTSTKEVINQYRKIKEERLTNVLTTESLVIKSIWKHGMKSAAVAWSKSSTKLPKNIYNFFIRYTNNTLAKATNMHK